jgi:hypothetical protein
MNDGMPTGRVVPLKDAVDLITSTTVSGVLYAYSFLICCLSTRLFYLQFRDTDRKLNHHTVFTVAVSSIVITCATVDIVTLNLYARTVYSDINTLPGGPDGGALVEVPGFVVVKTTIIATFIETIVSLGTQVSLHQLWLSSFHAGSVVASSDYLVRYSLRRTRHHNCCLAQCGRSW